MAILKASCYHKEGRHGDCEYGGNTYMLLFGVVQILMSHILDFHSMVLVSCGHNGVLLFFYWMKNIGNSTNSSNPLISWRSSLCKGLDAVSQCTSGCVGPVSTRASVKASPYGYQGTRPTRFTGSQIIMPLGLTIEHEEMLEVIRLEGHAVGQEDPFVSRDIHLLQLCSGIDENAVGRVLDKYFLSPNPKHRESYILLLLFSVASAKVFFKNIHPIGIIWDLVMLCQEVR
ncbi:hypothetical protein Hanom_Chr06g00560701 [Helianthus anomalus]